MELVTDLYPLTSLQIGDTQAYLSQAYLFFARASHKFLILVDNHSWRMNNNHSASIHLRELLAMKLLFFRPLFCWLWKLFQVPLGVCSAIGNHAVSFCNDIYEVLEGLLIIILNRVTEICHLATRLSEAKPATTEVSMWNSLWKDLFSKLFRALRSILNGLIAFLDSFNRHRFSTSNQLRKYSRRLSRLLSSGMGGSPLVLSPAEGCQKEVSENHEHID